MARLPRTAGLLVAGAFLVAAPGARADRSGALLRDCQDGRISGHYSAKDYETALRSMPADVDEYSDCRDTLRAAQLRAAGSAATGADAKAGSRAAGSAAAARARNATSGLRRAKPQPVAQAPSAVAAQAAPGAPPPAAPAPVAHRAPLHAASAADRTVQPGRLAVVLLVLAGFAALAGGYRALRGGR